MKNDFIYASGLFLVIGIVGMTIVTLSQSCTEQVKREDYGPLTHTILGQKESCMDCHDDYTGFVTYHEPKAIGCTPCHGGDPYAHKENKAHKGMTLVPGNLSSINKTCGTTNCHSSIAQRVNNSLMTSMSGVISVNKFMFGESESLDVHEHVKDLGLDHAADVHLRHLCASCHLGNEKTHPAPISEKSRGGGCVACHLDYHKPEDLTEGQKFHPAINLKVTNDHCFGCHSRSGRISTNYEGWHETRLDKNEYAGKDGYRLLQDGRIFKKAPSDVHHALGLECIDCHSSTEIMGDGQKYFHAEEAVKIRCEDCHFETPHASGNYNDLSDESKKLLILRSMDATNNKYVIGKDSKESIYNVTIDENNQAKMIAKNSQKEFLLSPPADICSRGDAHDDLSCSACHTAWVPQCIGCHNTYDQEDMAYDLLDKQKVEGHWVEHLGVFFRELPTLGMVDHENESVVRPFIPGMIMTIDKSNFPGNESAEEIFHRLFAPVAPHTTSKEGRSCTSCHNTPLALGYGRGDLEYLIKNGKGHWEFIPEYGNEPQDGLPQDAWIGFLSYPDDIVSTTRTNARPFTIEEQKRILTVGACLTCHKGDSKVMMNSLDDFEKTLKIISSKCVSPVW